MDIYIIILDKVGRRAVAMHTLALSIPIPNAVVATITS